MAKKKAKGKKSRKLYSVTAGQNDQIHQSMLIVARSKKQAIRLTTPELLVENSVVKATKIPIDKSGVIAATKKLEKPSPII